MPNLLRVVVTATDIAEGKQRDPFECPVASALQRVGVKHPRVEHSGVWYHSSHRRTSSGEPLRDFHVLPKHVTRKIEAFDDGKKIQPFNFDLRNFDLPDGGDGAER